MCSLTISQIIGKDLWLTSLPGVFAQRIKPGVPIIVEPAFLKKGFGLFDFGWFHWTTLHVLENHIYVNNWITF